MFDRIENKLAEVVEAILNKPASEFTKNDYDILSNELYKIHQKERFGEQNKKMMEMLTDMLKP